MDVNEQIEHIRSIINDPVAAPVKTYAAQLISELAPLLEQDEPYKSNPEIISTKLVRMFSPEIKNAYVTEDGIHRHCEKKYRIFEWQYIPKVTTPPYHQTRQQLQTANQRNKKHDTKKPSEHTEASRHRLTEWATIKYNKEIERGAGVRNAIKLLHYIRYINFGKFPPWALEMLSSQGLDTATQHGYRFS